MRPGRAADYSPLSSVAVTEEWSYTSTHPLGHTGPVTGTLYLYLAYVSKLFVNMERMQRTLFRTITKCACRNF